MDNNLRKFPKKKEKTIVARLKKKDKEAFIEAYDLYVDQIYRFIYFKVSNREEAQDLTSAVFLKTWNYIQRNTLEDINTLKALIYQVARTSVIDYYRKAGQTKKSSIDDLDDSLDMADGKVDIAKEAEINSDFKIIENKLNDLKDEYREIIVMRFLNELSINEISEIISRSKGSVRVLIHRAIKALRSLIDDDKILK